MKLDDFTAIAGLNNSGKSNLLRALHLFFTGNVEPSTSFSFKTDYNRHDLRSKKKKKDIRVTVEFDLPKQFKFRKRLEAVEELVGRQFRVTKAWSGAVVTPKYYLEDKELSFNDKAKIDQFLALINFRYIPNRVLPLEIIRNEHSALRDAIVRRLRRRLGKQDELFSKLRQTSEMLVEGIEQDLIDIANVDGVRLDMPTSWKDFVFSFGYKLASGEIEIDDSAQGSGIQSLLMLQTLALIDKDYYQQFGWRQASLWAIEEPESSMHTSLEAQVAAFLAKLATEPKGRLQIVGTTHSDLMLQAADSIVMVRMEKGRTKCTPVDKRTGLTQAARVGVSRFTHPLLAAPLCPLVLVEGKYDHAFLEQAFRLLAPSHDIRVSYLEELDNTDGATGGDKALQKYLKSHQQLLPIRTAEAPIFVLLDWDSDKSVKEFEKYCKDRTRYQVFSWPRKAFNPNLNDNFKGIERHMTDRIIEEANSKCVVLGKTKKLEWTVSPSDYKTKFKPAVFEVVKAGITANDLLHVKDFVTELIQELIG